MTDTFWHNYHKTVIPVHSSRTNRVGVYLDWPAGTLYFYSISFGALTHLFTFHSFTEPLYPGFGLALSLTLCHLAITVLG